MVRDDVLGRWNVTLDAAASSTSALVSNYLGPDHVLTERRNELAFDNWADLTDGGAAWLNPPYVPINLLSAFLSRAVLTATSGVPVLALLPASTGAGCWWTLVMDAGAKVEFLRGRLVLTGPHAMAGSPAPWPSALVLWNE